MQAATLIRYYQDDTHTLGCLTVQGVKDPVFWTMEPPWRDNRHNESCVPAGRYLCKPFSGQIYKEVYELQDVLGRDAILIHPGNFVRSTQGCILIGSSAGYMRDGGVDSPEQKCVISSLAALNKLKGLMEHGEFELTIIGGSLGA